MSERSSARPALLIAVITIACAGLLGLSGRTVTAAFINDVLIFLDGAHRIASGQVPNRDFHTALGPLVFYIPAIGYRLSGSFGAAMPLGMSLLMLAFLPAMIHITTTRLQPWLAVSYALFLTVILAAPINLGSPISLLSFAMFYNRIGWVALSLLLVMYLRPQGERRRDAVADGLAASFLLLVQIYTKVTYGLVGIGFIALLLTDRRQRRWAALTLGLTALACMLVELAWQGTFNHLQDLVAAARVSGERDISSLVFNLLNNLADVTVYALITGIALLATRGWRDVMFYGFCLGAGLLILNQNAHGWGIITLYAGAVVAVQRLQGLTLHQPGPAHSSLPARGLPLLLLFFIIPPIVHHAGALGLHTAYAVANAGTPLGLPRFTDVRTIDPPGGQPDFMMRYIDSIESGGLLLAGLDQRPERVLVLDFVNPFSAGLGLQPAKGDSSWLHWGRNVSLDSHLPPEALFAGVELVMLPKGGINGPPLQQLYGSYIRQEYQLLQETSAWTVYQRRQP
jgi:hypothetical protein